MDSFLTIGAYQIKLEGPTGKFPESRWATTPLVCRVDLVWDRYFEDSLKGRTRSNRGVGIRRKVTSNGILPKNWAAFLRCSENKKELFPDLSRHVIDEATSTKQSVATRDENVLYNNNIDASDMMPCTIEEADERIFVHENHAAKTYSRLLI